MKTIGLIGGMSWESTSEYYRIINETVRDRVGDLHSAKIVLVSVDFAEIEAMQMAGDWEAAGVALAEAAQQVERAGADFALICTNTMHKVFDQVQSAVRVPLLHLADATAHRIIDSGLTGAKVGLLGTAFTMEQSFYKDRLIAQGLDVILPDSDDRALVHRVIYDELCLGRIEQASRREFQRIINDLAAAGAQGIILGCTEIELLVDPDEPACVPLFPTSRIHAEAAVDVALAANSPTINDPTK